MVLKSRVLADLARMCGKAGAAAATVPAGEMAGEILPAK
jgi:hypothetical protein